MKTIINKIFWGFAFAIASLKGLDGLLINYHSRELYEIDIAELEKKGAGNSRYLKVNKGIALSEYVYYKEASDASSSSVEIFYPIVSQAQLASLKAGKSIRVKLLVQLKEHTKFDLENAMSLFPDSSSVTGLTKVGVENLDEEDYAQLQSNEVTMDKEAVLMEMGAQPIDMKWNLLLFVIGTIFSFTILKSFFRKASSLKEYWKKVTEEVTN